MDEVGNFTAEVPDFAKQNVKVPIRPQPRRNAGRARLLRWTRLAGADPFCYRACVQDADKGIIKLLKAKGRLVHAGTLLHSYPFCWRYETGTVQFALRPTYG